MLGFVLRHGLGQRGKEVNRDTANLVKSLSVIAPQRSLRVRVVPGIWNLFETNG